MDIFTSVSNDRLNTGSDGKIIYLSGQDISLFDRSGNVNDINNPQGMPVALDTLSKDRPFIYALILALCTTIFTINFNIPFGVIAGVSYILPVLATSVIPGRIVTIWTAVLCSSLSLTVLYYSPESEPIWQVLTNCSLTQFVIWMTAWFVMDRKLAEVILNRQQEMLEEDLHECKWRFAKAQQAAHMGSLDFDVSASKYVWSEEMCDILEIEPGRLSCSYKNYLEIIHPEDRLRFDKVCLNAIDEKKRHYDIEYRLLMKDGRVKHVHQRSDNNVDEDNAVIRSTGIVIDITTLRQTEAASIENEKKYRGLLENNPDGMTIVNAKGEIETVNRQLQKMTGYTHNELIGQAVEILTPERFISHKQKRKNYFANPLARFMGEGLELFVRRKDGSEFSAEISLSPLEMTDGLSITVAIRDISGRKKAEKALRKSEAMLEEAQRIAHVGSWEVDVQANSRAWSVEMCRIFELESKRLPDSYEAFLELIHPDDRMRFDQVYMGAINDNRQHYEIEHRLLMTDGRVKHIHQICENIFDHNGRLIRYIGTVIDVTERKHAKEELRKLTRAVEASSSIVIITDTDGRIEYVNPRFTKTTGYAMEEAIGRNPRFLQSGETPASVYAEIWKTICSGEEWTGDFRNRKKDGSLYWSRNSISGVKDALGDITHFITIQEDVTHEHELNEQLSYQANHDVLTGLVNRSEFERRTERLLSTIRQDNDAHALCFMDIDQFKVVNDTCGHTAGDELLRQLSMVLQHKVSGRDTLARLGGDEFGVLMEHCSLDHAHRVATTLQKAVQGYQFAWEGHIFRVGVSIGLVAITKATPNLSELLKQADAACYMAKDLGRNRLHVYHAEDSEMAQRHGEMRWVTRIYQALEEDRFHLYAQAIVPLDSSKEKHYELLLRMEDEKGNLIQPGAFLPAAERYNLISNLDRWVIRNTFLLLTKHPVFLDQVKFISINLSGQSLADESFLGFVIKQLQDTGIKGEKICFEITETAAISNLNLAVEFISVFKRLGCQFALDDFGSGLSSFGYLKNLPVDYLKIDGMFVKDIVEDPIDYAMVKSINEIGQVMGMQTIAEFVENDEIKGMLREIGVNYAQGYGIGEPQAFDELLDQGQNK